MPFGFDLILVGPRPLARRPRTGVFGLAAMTRMPPLVTKSAWFQRGPT